MATSGGGLKVYRELYREFRRIHPKVKLSDVPAYNYMVDQFRSFSLTGRILCREENEVLYVADTYRCLLQSVRRHEELLAFYAGKGERSVESSAKLVGLSLPETENISPKEPKQ